MRGVCKGGYWVVAALLCLGFWQFGHGAYIPAKAWLAQELMQRAWDRASAGEDRATPWPWADTWPVARLTAEARGVDLIILAGGSGRTLAFEPTNGERHVYQVVGVDIVDSRKGSLVLDTNVAMLSLVTCYPFDALEAGGPLRYVVTARMLF